MYRSIQVIKIINIDVKFKVRLRVRSLNLVQKFSNGKTAKSKIEYEKIEHNQEIETFSSLIITSYIFISLLSL